MGYLFENMEKMDIQDAENKIAELEAMIKSMKKSQYSSPQQ